MSMLPAVATATATATSVLTVLNPLEQIITSFNTNPYFIGLMMLLLNLGGRFIGMEVSKEQEKVFQHPWVRRGLIFTVLFVATRNVLVALIMSVIVLFLLSFLFNENSDLCLWKMCGVDDKKPKDGPIASVLTPEELDIFRRLNEKQIRLTSANISKTDKDTETKEKTKSAEDFYMLNMMRLNGGS